MRTKPKTITKSSIVDENKLNFIEWRCIGPFRGGRCVAVAGDPSDPLVFYHGATAGGVWKTYDAGTYWTNVSDGFFTTAAVGAIAVAESDSNVIYVGTGEACLRSDVSHGNGVYKSTDGGKTWVNVGLCNTRHIARIRIHPQNSDIVYVAALGHAYGHNPERGVFRSNDGGLNWEHILFKSEQAGSIDISMDSNNPRILYAALFQVLRRPWDMSSGGPDSGLYKSTDGGDTWTELTNNSGMPAGIKGRIGVAVSPANSQRVWALIEAAKGGLFRSDNGGETWELLNDSRDLLRRAWSYNHLFADTKDPETCWVLGYNVWKSTNGGHTFANVSMPHGDHHDLWIDPRNPQRMIEGSDGGATVSLNGGFSWSNIHNQPTASLFHVATDNQFPYRVYSTQMDNTAIRVPSRTFQAAIAGSDCLPVSNSESGHIAVRPDNSDIIYAGAIGSSPGGGGNLYRYDQRTGQAKLITVWPENTDGSTPEHDKYRFAFTFPIVLSPHDPNVLYCAGNVVFQSKDEGNSWKIISPDLTQIDAAKLADWSGGPITTDGLMNNSYAGTIYSFVESPHEQGVFWAGTDDGAIHLSRDSGKTWENVTPKGLPDWFLVSMIEVSPHNPATAYTAITRFNLDDFQPYLYKTNDYGKTWEKITNGIPYNDFTRVVRADPERPGLLYAGTETGVYASFDDGLSWQPLQGNLPLVPIYDLLVKEGDLVACTHGRSLWILDDLTPLHQLTDEVMESPAHLFKVCPAYRIVQGRVGRESSQGINYVRVSSDNVAFYEAPTADGRTKKTFLDAGSNPPNGVMVKYYLRQKPETGIMLTFLDAKGELINSYPGPAETGVNTFVWDMQYPSEHLVDNLVPLAEQSARGIAPIAPPGLYKVQMTMGTLCYEESFELRKDPRSSATQEGFEAQFELHMKIRDKLSQTNESINSLRSVRNQIESWEHKARQSTGAQMICEAAEHVKTRLQLIESELIRVHSPKAMKLPPTKLNVKLASLTYVVATAEGFPTQQSFDVLDNLASRVDEQLRRLQQVIDTDMPKFVARLNELGIPTVAL